MILIEKHLNLGYRKDSDHLHNNNSGANFIVGATELNGDIMAKSELTDLLNTIDQLGHELSAAKKIIWAAGSANGGSLIIPDAIMKLADDSKNSIDSYYDAQRKATVLKAVTAPIVTLN